MAFFCLGDATVLRGLPANASLGIRNGSAAPRATAGLGMWRAFLARTTLVAVAAERCSALGALLKLSTAHAISHD